MVEVSVVCGAMAGARHFWTESSNSNSNQILKLLRSQVRDKIRVRLFIHSFIYYYAKAAHET